MIVDEGVETKGLTGTGASLGSIMDTSTAVSGLLL